MQKYNRLFLYTTPPYAKRQKCGAKRRYLCVAWKCELSPQRRIRRDARRGEHFGEGERKPDAAVAEHLRQQDEAGHEEDSTAQQREHHCRAHALNALKVADAHEVDDEEHEGDSHQWETLDGDWEGSLGGAHEEFRKLVGEQHEGCTHGSAAQHGGEQRHLQRGAHAVSVADAVVVADDGLRRLRHGVAYHVDERCVVARYAERAHARVAHIGYEYVVAHEREHRHCALAHESRYAYGALIADVAHGVE